MTTSNAKELTRSHAIYTAKKRARKAQIQEVVFDEDARREYLTGFRKRNLLKKEAKAKSAKERARLERLELRKQHRQELAERAAQNVREVEGALGAILDMSGSALAGPSNTHQGGGPQEELEFEDEEQLAVVTVVKDFTTDSLMNTDSQPHSPKARPLAPDWDGTPHPPDDASQPRMQSIPSSGKERVKPKVKARKIRYETKAARKSERKRQYARHTEKAERAKGKKGGKQKR